VDTRRSRGPAADAAATAWRCRGAPHPL